MNRAVRAAIVLAVGAGVLLPAGAASARPVLDQPSYCQPGTAYVNGHCVGKGVWLR